MCEESFHKLTTMLTLALVLTLPIEGKNFTVFCNVSCLGLGVALMQDQNVIAYSLR